MANNIPAGQEYFFRPYRWVILVAIALIQFTTNFANIQSEIVLYFRTYFMSQQIQWLKKKNPIFS